MITAAANLFVWVCDQTQSVSRSVHRVMRLTRACGFWDFKREPCASVQWSSVTEEVLQARASEAKADCWKRTGKGQRWIPVCVMVHTTDCIIHHQAKGRRRMQDYIWVCLSLSVFVCLWWEGMWVLRNPPFHPLFFPVLHRGKKEQEKKQQEGETGASKSEKGLCVSKSSLRVPGVLYPSSTHATGPVSFSYVAVIRKGRSKGAAECHCSVLALRAARV